MISAILDVVSVYIFCMIGIMSTLNWIWKLIKSKRKYSYYCKKCKHKFTLPYYCIHYYQPNAPKLK